jgi:hypothetical protein
VRHVSPQLVIPATFYRRGLIRLTKLSFMRSASG